MTRIIAGAARGRRLAVPRGTATRPTSDRAREALFSALEAMRGPWRGVRMLDLYAGSGAVGLEALSRGAEAVVLVETDVTAIRAVRTNIAILGLSEASVVGSSVERMLATPASRPFDVVFADPPYSVSSASVLRVLEALRDGRWLAPSAVVVVERGTRDGALEWPSGYTAERSRRYGEATLWYGRAAMARKPGPDAPGGE